MTPALRLCTLAVIVVGTCTSAIATENRANDYLLSAKLTERAAVLSGVVGEGCKVVRTFYRGFGTGALADGNGIGQSLAMTIAVFR